MKQSKPIIYKSRVIEDLQQLQLTMLLEELVRDRGIMKTAEMLGVDHRTLTNSLRAGRLSKRMRSALGSALQEGFGSAAARQRERNDQLEKRLDKMEGQLKEVKQKLQDGLKGLNKLEGRFGRTEGRLKELKETLPADLRRLRMSLDGVRKYYTVQRHRIEQRLSALESGCEGQETGASAGDKSRVPRWGSITPSKLRPREFRGPPLSVLLDAEERSNTGMEHDEASGGPGSDVTGVAAEPEALR